MVKWGMIVTLAVALLATASAMPVSDSTPVYSSKGSADCPIPETPFLKPEVPAGYHAGRTADGWKSEGDGRSWNKEKWDETVRGAALSRTPSALSQAVRCHPIRCSHS
jgi:hypothetical protein